MKPTKDNGLQCRGSNSVTGIYIAVLNLKDFNRSNRDGYLTVQILKNSDLKGDKFNKCWERLTNDIKELVLNGFKLPNGDKACVRLVQYRCDNLEKHKILRKPENFSSTEFPSSHSYITTQNRKDARNLEDILPENFELVTEETYKVSYIDLNLIRRFYLVPFTK